MSEFENKNNNLEFRKNLRSRKFDDSKTANAKRKKTIFFFSIICSMAISAPLIYPKMAEKNDAFANIFNNDKPSNNLIEGKLDDKEENVKSSDDTNKSNSETLAASSVEPTTLNNETSVANSSANEPSTTSSETTAAQTQESQKSSNSV